MGFREQLQEDTASGQVPEKVSRIFEQFYLSYMHELASFASNPSILEPIFSTLLELIKKQIREPYTFQPYHQNIRSPFDYYSFGLDFLRPLVDFSLSSIGGMQHLEEIALHVKNGNNIILLANHQIEADPQAISLLLGPSYPELAEDMIFVAGERVITDPLAVPFSLGRNLLCIYSKRYIDYPPELKLQKQIHNKRTMELMSELLSHGGKCIYVAPSGGRDRPNKEGVVEVAPFDPQSIEMFNLMAKKSTRPTFFYTLALKTYTLLPPPETIQIDLGETRRTKRGGIHLCFGSHVDMEHYEGCDHPDKHERRMKRALHIWNQVAYDYASFAHTIPNVIKHNWTF
jgi:glycerol-3-phosphate O-acyltransferase